MNSKFILGTVQFGMDYGINNAMGKPSKEQVFNILKYAASQGIELLDTADAYGNATKILGDFNNTHPRQFEVNTKFKGIQETLTQQLSFSLKLLHIRSINTYFFHSYRDFVNSPKLLNELGSLKKENLIKKIGVSIYDNKEFKTAIDSPVIDVIQFPFNLLDNQFQRGELIKLAKSKGKELQVRSVFLQGLFFKSLDRIPYVLTSLKPHLQKIHELSNEFNIPLYQLALLYALAQTEIDNVIIGVDNFEQLQNNINIGQNCLAPEITEMINKIEVQETELLYPKNW